MKSSFCTPCTRGGFLGVKKQEVNIRAALVVYILPLVFMFFGMILVNYGLDIMGKESSEIFMLFGGLFFLAISMLVIKAIDHKVSHKKGSVFRITKVMKD